MVPPSTSRSRRPPAPSSTTRAARPATSPRCTDRRRRAGPARHAATSRSRRTTREAAGYDAVIIFNEGQPGRTRPARRHARRPTGRSRSVGLSFADGAALVRAAAQAGGDGRHVVTSTNSVDLRQTTNVHRRHQEGRRGQDAGGRRAPRLACVGGPGHQRQRQRHGDDPRDRRGDVRARASSRARSVRFAFWGAEESDLLGSSTTSTSLTDDAAGEICANLNFDMLGSPNYVRFVYDGDGSRHATARPPGSGADRGRCSRDYFAGQGLADRADRVRRPLRLRPVHRGRRPAGGLFSGAEGEKTAEQAADLRRHRRREPYDPCATGTGKTRTLQLSPRRSRRPGCRCSPPTSRATCRAWPCRARAARRRRSAGRARAPFAPRGFPTEYLALGGIGAGVPVRATVSDFGPQLLAKVLGANQTQEQSLGLVFHYADAKGLPLVDLADLRALLTFLDSDEGKAELKGIGGLSGATVGVLLRSLVGLEEGGGDRVLRRAAVRDRRPAADRGGRARRDLVPRAAGRAGQAEAVLDRADVAAGRAVRGAAGGRRPRQAEARVLLRRGAPAVRRRHRGVPRLGRPDRAADPLQGRRRLLRHPEPAGPAGRGARPARLARPARAARVHARRREGAEGDGRRPIPSPTSTTSRSC